MMIGHPTVEVLPWLPLHEDPAADDLCYSPFSPQFSESGSAPGDLVAALRRFLPSNRPDKLEEDGVREAADSPVDVYSSDHFRMYEFKVRRCSRGLPHDWTECPFAHPGEKARRRDPRKYHYFGASCPEFRKGSCRKGEACELAHGVFECWLHPARYRTQPCKDGANCRRRVCFFAHTQEQLRVITQQSPMHHGSCDYYDLSLQRQSSSRVQSFVASPPDESDSPPLSPMAQSLGTSLGSGSVSDSLAASLRSIQMGKVNSSLAPSWASQYSSPRGSMLRPSCCFNVTATPTQVQASSALGFFDKWENSGGQLEEEPTMERVESGRGLRTRIFERLSKDNPLELGQASHEEPCGAPDVGWVSELLK
ncbi:hypothetical protein SAY86_018415 [Trapa natans]|uniref:C3H1-type domain-containing protein n=1 Tax=Trapa natans TaxID=22666 RepID=A0AAN7LCP3_TRANT|nr:hypothetical protein SAY86_018415 [Trapa natans]